MTPTYVLGVSAYYHDSAASLLRDGEIVAAAQEERFTRKKGDASFPHCAVSYCLEKAGIGVADLRAVGFYDKPLLKFERILETYLGVVPKGFKSFRMAGPLWIKEKLFTESELRKALEYEGDMLYAEHHESHAASAFYPSPFEEAAILTMDGVGEWATASTAVGSGNRIELQRELHWPDSLGLLYSAFTYFTGFKVNSGEYKVMGLAPYGQPKYVDVILSEMMDLREDGSFRLNQDYFNYLSGLTMTSDKLADLFDGPPRAPESRITQREMDLARSVQEVCEKVMMRMAGTVHKDTGLTNLCLAGGVALNCVGNGKLLREGPFENIWIQPAAGDAGGALGVAQLIWHRHLEKPRNAPNGTDSMRGAYLGPEFSADEIEEYLKRIGASYEKLGDGDLATRAAELLGSENVVGWFQGRMEFGPRALGNRSILGDPRSPKMQEQMNLKIKFRESFRPFAPSVPNPPQPTHTNPEGARARLLRDGRGIPVYASRRSREGGAPDPDVGGGPGALGHRAAERSPVGHSGRDARRLLGPGPDCLEGHEPAVPPPHQRVCRANGMCRGREHVLQRAGRADRLYARTRIHVLHADADGLSRSGAVPTREK